MKGEQGCEQQKKGDFHPNKHGHQPVFPTIESCGAQKITFFDSLRGRGRIRLSFTIGLLLLFIFLTQCAIISAFIIRRSLRIAQDEISLIMKSMKLDCWVKCLWSWKVYCSYEETERPLITWEISSPSGLNYQIDLRKQKKLLLREAFRTPSLFGCEWHNQAAHTAAESFRLVESFGLLHDPLIYSACQSSNHSPSVHP